MGYHSKLIHELFHDSFEGLDIKNAEIKECSNKKRVKFCLSKKDFENKPKYFLLFDFVNQYYYCIANDDLIINRNRQKTSIELKNIIEQAKFITNNILTLKKFYEKEIAGLP